MIDIHPLNVCIDPLVCRKWATDCPFVQSNSSSSEEAMDETSPRPKMGGSLFLGVGLPFAIRTPASAVSERQI